MRMRIKEISDGERAVANAVSDAIASGFEAGVPFDNALSAAASMIADYARFRHGERGLALLAELIVERSKFPLPHVGEWIVAHGGTAGNA